MSTSQFNDVVYAVCLEYCLLALTMMIIMLKHSELSWKGHCRSLHFLRAAINMSSITVNVALLLPLEILKNRVRNFSIIDVLADFYKVRNEINDHWCSILPWSSNGNFSHAWN